MAMLHAYKVKFWYPYVKQPFFVTLNGYNYKAVKERIKREHKSKVRGTPSKFELLDKTRK